MKRCARCGDHKSPSHFYKASPKASAKDGLYAYCKPCTLDWQREWRAKKKEDPAWLERERGRARRRATRHARKLRSEVIAAYGGACACCGESTVEFLALDHVHEDGAAHRRELFGTSRAGSTAMYRWAQRNGYPDSLQLLCHNCNTAKASYGACPHTA